MDTTDGLVRGMAVEEHRRADPGAGRPRGPRPHPERRRRAGRRGGPGHTPRRRCRSTARRRSSPTSRCSVEMFETGIKVIDLLAPYRRGGKIGLFGGAGVGKTVSSWSSSTTSPRSTAASRCSPASASAPARATTSTTRWRSRSCPTAASVLSKTALVYGQMNEPPGARAARRALGAHRRRVLPRRRGAGRAAVHRQHLPLHPGGLGGVGAPRPHPVSAVGYQPTLATEMGELQERITSTSKDGSITSVQAIYVPADDLTDPAPATAFAHLDATTVLSRAHLRDGHLPGRRSARLDVDDPLARASSASEHYTGRPRRCSRSCSATRSCRTSSPSSAWTSCPRTTS